MRGDWRGQGAEGHIFQVGKDELGRVGHCWAAGRLRAGDLVLCAKQTGDCFYDFYLLNADDYSNRPGMSLSIVPVPFGSYTFANPVLKLTGKEFARLLSGATVETAAKVGTHVSEKAELDARFPAAAGLRKAVQEHIGDVTRLRDGFHRVRHQLRFNDGDGIDAPSGIDYLIWVDDKLTAKISQENATAEPTVTFVGPERGKLITAWDAKHAPDDPAVAGPAR